MLIRFSDLGDVIKEQSLLFEKLLMEGYTAKSDKKDFQSYYIYCLARQKEFPEEWGVLDHFVLMDHDTTKDCSNSIVEAGQVSDESHVPTRLFMVTQLVDAYLAEVAPDVNLKLQKFQSLAAFIPEKARLSDDGIYLAIDIYLKAHPWLKDSEKEHICKLMTCGKLTLEASMHAAQNERLPLHIVVQNLFFEQLRLRSSLSDWFQENTEKSQNLSGNLALIRNEVSAPAQAGTKLMDRVVAVDDMKERVSELEKECLSMKQEIEKLMKTKGGWNAFLKRFTLRLKPKPDVKKPSKASCYDSEELPTSVGPVLNDGKEKNEEVKELRD